MRKSASENNDTKTRQQRANSPFFQVKKKRQLRHRLFETLLGNLWEAGGWEGRVYFIKLLQVRQRSIELDGPTAE